MLCPVEVRRGSVVGIATAYGLDVRGVGVRVQVGSRIFTCHIGHPTSYPTATEDSSPGRGGGVK
jgi:hypothetical protein